MTAVRNDERLLFFKVILRRLSIAIHNFITHTLDEQQPPAP